MGGGGAGKGGLGCRDMQWESGWGVNPGGQPLSCWPDHAPPSSKRGFHNPRRQETVQASFSSVICLHLYCHVPNHALSKSLQRKLELSLFIGEAPERKLAFL